MFAIKEHHITNQIKYLCVMAKTGKEKNTKNKGKHSKLMDRKKNKLRDQKELRKLRLKEIVQAAKARKESL
jgi:hypothetical protein